VYVAFIPLHGFWLEFSNSNKISKVLKKLSKPISNLLFLSLFPSPTQLYLSFNPARSPPPLSFSTASPFHLSFSFPFLARNPAGLPAHPLSRGPT
jgi:hypothetical protein